MRLRRSWSSVIAVVAASCLWMAAFGAASAVTTVTWWQSWTDTPERTAALEALVAEFEKENPDVKVQLEFVTWSQIGERLIVALAGGTPPEVTMLLPEDCVAMGAQGAVIPLNRYVEMYGIDLGAFIPGDLQRGEVNGTLCGLPHISGAGQRFIAYNRTLFDEFGFPDESPATWSDLRSISQRSVRIGSDGSVETVGYLDYGAWTFWAPFIYSNDGSLFGNGGTVATINTPQVAEAVDYLADLVALQGGHGVTTQMGNRIVAFVNGRRSLIAGAQSLFKDLSDRAFDLNELGIGPIPYNDRNPDARSQGITISGWYMSVVNGLDPEVEDAAFRWVEFMTARADQGGRFPMTMGRPSPLIEVNYDPSYYEVNPLWSQVIELFARDIGFPILPVTEPIMQNTHALVMQVIRGETATTGALEEAQRIAEGRLAEYLSSR